ncbi:NACHT N-terminal Helical domain 1-containing protein [Streptomyces boetiae]|uniref:NACHT N-terminal Helical domain 1-containing protein n=1 Tax=Streptomyces boetiae TaxID=3075541 RepID=UPI00374E12D2
MDLSAIGLRVASGAVAPLIKRLFRTEAPGAGLAGQQRVRIGSLVSFRGARATLTAADLGKPAAELTERARRSAGPHDAGGVPEVPERHGPDAAGRCSAARPHRATRPRNGPASPRCLLAGAPDSGSALRRAAPLRGLGSAAPVTALELDALTEDLTGLGDLPRLTRVVFSYLGTALLPGAWREFERARGLRKIGLLASALRQAAGLGAVLNADTLPDVDLTITPRPRYRPPHGRKNLRARQALPTVPRRMVSAPSPLRGPAATPSTPRGRASGLSAQGHR